MVITHKNKGAYTKIEGKEEEGSHLKFDGISRLISSRSCLAHIRCGVMLFSTSYATLTKGVSDSNTPSCNTSLGGVFVGLFDDDDCSSVGRGIGSTFLATKQVKPPSCRLFMMCQNITSASSAPWSSIR